MGWLSILNAVILSFLLAELIRVLFFTQKWKFRFHKNPRPIEHWKKALVVMLLFVFIFPFVNWFFVNYISSMLDNLGFYQISLFFVLFPVTYLWIDKWILGSDWENIDVLPVFVIVVDLILTIIL
ncbi:MAG: hypothetical protein KKF56_03345 [Nanoarchaeota archaeon]|nr:hypothetical protein [Nanoarchaeota archaeon]